MLRKAFLIISPRMRLWGMLSLNHFYPIFAANAALGRLNLEKF